MHIVLVSADGGLGGLPRHIEDLALGLTEAGDNVSVIAPSGPLLKKLSGTKKIETIALPFRSSRDMATAWQLRRIYKAIRGSSETVLHVHGVRAGWLARIAAAGLKMPLIYTEHLLTREYVPPSRWRKAVQVNVMRRLNGWTDKTIAVSEAVKRFLLAEKIALPTKVQVIYHGLRVTPPMARPKEGRPPIIGCVGAFVPTKRIDVLMRACGLLYRDDTVFRLELVGDGPERTSLERMAAELGITEIVSFLGAVAEPELAMIDWTLAAVPSDSESFSLAALEAEAMGLPVVASNVGGLPEVVADGQSGLLTPPNNPPALRRALEELLTNSVKRQALSVGAINKAKQFSFAKMITETRAVYQEVLAKPNRS